MEYIDLIVLGVLIIIVAIFFGNFKSFLFLIGISEFFLQIVRYVANNINNIQIKIFLRDYFPSSLFSIIDNYSSGFINTVLSWALLVIFILWLGHLIKYFFKRK